MTRHGLSPIFKDRSKTVSTTGYTDTVEVIPCRETGMSVHRTPRRARFAPRCGCAPSRSRGRRSARRPRGHADEEASQVAVRLQVLEQAQHARSERGEWVLVLCSTKRVKSHDPPESPTAFCMSSHSPWRS